ncbi:lecithin retinol acyltransferase family protein [Tenacibaculum dicentrarchi]|uniref:LRAT domain-containing protein n=1 Tax=Tenacibaculum dicentrarchi TaxID=669041 RepID=A0ABP1EKL4_9FLAO
MNLTTFTTNYQLEETDAIVLKKSFLGMVDHYVIYMGKRENRPIFIANFQDGIKEIPYYEIQKYLNKYQPERIERFQGSYEERAIAFKRAVSRIGEKAYNYVSNNCEHFKNWVHYGENYSKQVNAVGNGAIVTGLTVGTIGLAKKNKTTAIVGASIIILGGILKKLSNN